MKNKTLIFLISICLILIVFILIGKKRGWIGGDLTVEVTTEPVQRRNIVETVSANGKIQPETEVKISPDVSGEIIVLNVEEGDRVKKGDLLARINPDIYQSALERAQAALNTAQANLANARARLAQMKAQLMNAENSYKRNKQLLDEKAISQAEFESAEVAFKVAQAEVEASGQSVAASEFNVKSAEASLKEAKESLEKTTIYSPIDGTVSMLNVEEGERVVGTIQMAGTEMMRIANLNSMEVLVEVNENDIIRVNRNDTAMVDVDAYLDRKFKGIVTEIANSAKTNGLDIDQVTNFEVKVRILPESYQDLIDTAKKSHSPFRPGMTATVDIQTEIAENILTVPIQSVTTREDTLAEEKKKKYGKHKEPDEETGEGEQNSMSKDDYFVVVFLFDKGKAKIRVVETGIQDNDYIQIRKGLSEGDEVITAPYSAISKRLENGREVEKVTKEELFETD